MTEAFDEREARKRYIRRRQGIVLGCVGTVLVAALITATLFYTHVIGAGAGSSSQAQPNYGVQAPCAPKDKAGIAAKYVDNSSVQVRILNGTKFAGLAKAVGNALINRDFEVTTIGTSNEKVERTVIHFGRDAIAQAYTVNANFTDAIMQMDDRKDQLIDVVIGPTFTDLQDQKKVPAAGGEIDSISGCVAADGLRNVPKAQPHTVSKESK
ncbi:MAG: LytR C-terminal domain-containing protein [Bifidobacterium sp.]|jgi:hypothetical protein|nr:LytR C-terminal domain-containing protein [Bifidobacterium sp.]